MPSSIAPPSPFPHVFSLISPARFAGPIYKWMASSADHSILIGCELLSVANVLGPSLGSKMSRIDAKSYSTFMVDVQTSRNLSFVKKFPTEYMGTYHLAGTYSQHGVAAVVSGTRPDPMFVRIFSFISVMPESLFWCTSKVTSHPVSIPPTIDSVNCSKGWWVDL